MVVNEQSGYNSVRFFLSSDPVAFLPSKRSGLRLHLRVSCRRNAVHHRSGIWRYQCRTLSRPMFTVWSPMPSLLFAPARKGSCPNGFSAMWDEPGTGTGNEPFRLPNVYEDGDQRIRG